MHYQLGIQSSVLYELLPSWTYTRSFVLKKMFFIFCKGCNKKVIAKRKLKQFCIKSCRDKYFYVPTPRTIEKRKKFGEKRKIEKNPAWKGEKATIKSIHDWVNNNFGRLKKCEHCGIENAKQYDWSNKYHTYKRAREDWQRLCRKCHVVYDIKYLNLHEKRYANKTP